MPLAVTGIHVDSLLLRATFKELPIEPRALSEAPRSTSYQRALVRLLRRSNVPLSDFGDLPEVSRRLLGLHEVIMLAKQIPEPKLTMPPNISEEGRRFLETQKAEARDNGPVYRVISVEMTSPLSAVLEIPPEAAAAFGFALLLLLERIATAQTRVSKKRAKDLRDKALYDRERALIETGRLDMAVELLRRYPKPAVVELVSGDETFDDAEPVEPGQLELLPAAGESDLDAPAR
jgi:hypothetical protein